VKKAGRAGRQDMPAREADAGFAIVACVKRLAELKGVARGGMNPILPAPLRKDARLNEDRRRGSGFILNG